LSGRDIRVNASVGHREDCLPRVQPKRDNHFGNAVIAKLVTAARYIVSLAKITLAKQTQGGTDER
jgi:hypothetical protein